MNFSSVLQWRDFVDSRRLVCLALVATGLAITGPFGTYYLPFHVRGSYWAGWLLAIWLPTTILFLFAHRMLVFESVNQVLRSIFVLLASVPLAALCAVSLASLYFETFPLTLENVIAEAFVLWPCSAGIVLLLHFTHDFKMQTASTRGMAGSSFFDRIPQTLGRNLLAISSADHYVQVRTDLGEALVLLSLKRAEEELHHYKGIRIHRGHWVALDAVAAKVWRDARLFLQLKDGSELPVGRSYRSRVLKHIE